METKAAAMAFGKMAAVLAFATTTASAAVSTSESVARTIVFGPVVKSGGEGSVDLRARSRAESATALLDRSAPKPLLIYIR